jgi:spoIIIJ-associated protein
MQVIETTAKTKEEAIEIALKELGAERGEVEINVVSLGKTGILGIGSEPARVRVTMLEETPDMVRVAGEVLNNLISKMGVSVVTNLKQAEREDEGGPAFDIEGEDSGLLIGRRGETLRALQFLVKVIVGRRMQTKANLSVDAEGYQERRYQALRNLAQRVGQRVVSSGRSVTLEPMPPDERRIVHMTLAEYSGVTSESMGDGDSRQVVVMLDEQ